MSKEKARFTIYVSMDGRPAVIAGAAASLPAAIAQCERAIEAGLQVYARGYGADPAVDVWSVYDEREAVTRWRSDRP